MSNYLNIPFGPPVNHDTGEWMTGWFEWIQKPSFLALESGTALGVASGGTGTNATPGLNQFLLGDGSGNYTLSSSIPAAALPAFTGDATKTAGGTVLTLATVNTNVGSWGTATAVATFTVNAKGLITAASNTNITGSAGAFTAVGAFGCNGKAAQTSAAVGTAIAGAAGVVYTATEQGLINSLLALVNQLRAALVANGITV
jgi:hypothetical protein